MRWFLLAAAGAALVVAAGACGSAIAVPDQGVIVYGCQAPGQCYLQDCPCTAATIGTDRCVHQIVLEKDCTNPTDLTTCNCPTAVDNGSGMTVATQCLETAQACVGRGVFCGGKGAVCRRAGKSCSDTEVGDPPMLVPTMSMPDGGTPGLEPHCQFADDVCCAGTDGGVVSD